MLADHQAGSDDLVMERIWPTLAGREFRLLLLQLTARQTEAAKGRDRERCERGAKQNCSLGCEKGPADLPFAVAPGPLSMLCF